MMKKIIGALIATVGVFVFVANVSAQSTLKNAYVTTTNSVSAQASVRHTFVFFHPGATFGSATFQYCANASGSSCTATGFTTSAATEYSVLEGAGDDSGNWATTGASDTITVNSTTADTDANNTWTFGFGGITNPNISSSTNCAGSGTNTRTCYILVKTYEGTDLSTQSGAATLSTTVTNSVTVSATVDPSFSLVISGVRPSQTAAANGTTLTSTVTPTVTTIPFGNLTPGTEKFVAQSATVTTNAYNGYTITARMEANMTGDAYNDDIDPFTSGSATFTVADSWALPDGTTSGTDTGWLGVGTDDTAVSGQGGASSNKFFSLGTTPTTVASQSTSAQSELDIFVYAIEVNSYQRADAYSGTLRYHVLPTY